MNKFTIDTDEYYPVCYKVNDAKIFKNVVALYYFMLANHHLYYRLARLAAAFKIIAIDFVSAVFYQVSLEVHQTIYMCWILFICKGATNYIENIN